MRALGTQDLLAICGIRLWRAEFPDGFTGKEQRLMFDEKIEKKIQKKK